MAIKDLFKRRARDMPSSAVVTQSGWNVLCSDNYRPLSSCPEVQMCVGVYADLIGSMTLHLMRNGEKGDERVKNALSRKMDIEPSRDMTRITFIQNLVRVLLLNGNQVTYPEYKEGLLDNLAPLQPSLVGFEQSGERYLVRYGGKRLTPDEVLHFVLNPNQEQPWRGDGLTISIKDAVASLRQADATRNALLRSPAPSIIVKVDGLSEDFSSAEGRAKLRKQYLTSSDAGEPWFIPAEAFSVEQVKPLTINDLAISTHMELDKKTIAAAFGVPAFLVGVGEFNQDAYRHFLSTRVMAVAKVIEQELTKKLLLSPDLYFKFNALSLYSYSMSELVSAGTVLVDHMALRRNELRDMLGLTPDADMEELLGLENYIPANRLGDQEKLKGGETDESKPEADD